MKKLIAVAVVRRMIADYMYSEGCDCCRDVEAHKIHAKKLAKILNVPMYSDKSGYDFYEFRTIPKRARKK